MTDSFALIAMTVAILLCGIAFAIEDYTYWKIYAKNWKK